MPCSTDEDDDGNVDTLSDSDSNYNPPIPEPEPITEKQQKKLFVLLKDKSREERLKIVSSIIGRQIESSNDLTKAEASKIIDALENSEPF